MKDRKRRQRGSPGRTKKRTQPAKSIRADGSGASSLGDRYHVFFLCLFGLISAALFDAFSNDKHLSADGVHYFVMILDRGDFFQVDGARRFAEYLIQWPLVLAVRVGVTHVPVLSSVFALGIYLPYLLSFGLCLHAVRRESFVLLSLPLLSMACVNLPAHFILAGEHHVMVLLASPILLLIMRRERPTRWDGILLVLMLGAFSRTYPTALVPALFFSVLLAVRLYSDRGDLQTTVFRGLAFAFSIATMAIATYSALNPRVSANQEFFRLSLPMVFWHAEVLLPATFAVLFLLSLVSRWRIWPILSAVCLALFVPFVLRAGHGMTALESFSARTLSITLLPTLLLLAVAVHYRAPELAGFRKAVLAGMILTIVVWNFRQSADWARYRGEMERVVRAERGCVPLAATRLDHDPCRWGWTSSELSVVWSYPVVRAIVENRPSEPTVPFDPRRRLILKRYVQYDAVFAGTDPTARLVPAQ